MCWLSLRYRNVKNRPTVSGSALSAFEVIGYGLGYGYE